MNFKDNEDYKLLVKAIISVNNESDCEALLEDLMTRKEIMDIAQRLMVAKLLSQEVVYNKIVEETGASTATISRVNRCYQYGSGGYAKILKEIGDKS